MQSDFVVLLVNCCDSTQILFNRSSAAEEEQVPIRIYTYIAIRTRGENGLLLCGRKGPLSG